MAAGDIILTGTISTSAASDVYPTHKAELCLGGYRSVADIAARNAIPAQRREEGMAVYVVAESKRYILKGGIADANWVEDAGGGGGSGELPELTEERVVGTLNGKHVYEKLYIANVPSSGSGILVDVTDLYIDILVDITGCVNQNASAIVGNNYEHNTTNNLVEIYLNPTKKSIDVYSTGNNYKSQQARITISYTKTTD